VVLEAKRLLAQTDVMDTECARPVVHLYQA
jgi:hypothetical protein